MLEHEEKKAIRLLIDARSAHLDDCQATIDWGRETFKSPEMIERLDEQQAYVDKAREEVKDALARLGELYL